MRRPDRFDRRVAGLVIAAALAGCDGQEPTKAVTAPASSPKAPEPEPPVRDMKPAELKPEAKAVDAKSTDDLPLVAPSGAKDERPDAKPR